VSWYRGHSGHRITSAGRDPAQVATAEITLVDLRSLPFDPRYPEEARYGETEHDGDEGTRCSEPAPALPRDGLNDCPAVAQCASTGLIFSKAGLAYRVIGGEERDLHEGIQRSRVKPIPRPSR
jgi:hypothetical protein